MISKKIIIFPIVFGFTSISLFLTSCAQVSQYEPRVILNIDDPEFKVNANNNSNSPKYSTLIGGQGGHMGVKVSITLFLKELMKSRQVFWRPWAVAIKCTSAKMQWSLDIRVEGTTVTLPPHTFIHAPLSISFGQENQPSSQAHVLKEIKTNSNQTVGREL